MYFLTDDFPCPQVCIPMLMSDDEKSHILYMQIYSPEEIEASSLFPPWVDRIKGLRIKTHMLHFSLK